MKVCCSFFRIFLAAVIFVVTIHSSCFAEELRHMYFGYGYSNLHLQSSNPLFDGENVDGGTFIVGGDLGETWAFDGRITSANGTTDDASKTSIDFSSLGLNVRKCFWPIRDRQWAPWVTAGVGYASVDVDTPFGNEYDGGFTVDIGFGSDVKISRNWRLRLEFQRTHTSQLTALDASASLIYYVPNAVAGFFEKMAFTPHF